jgi:acetyl-CoA carboxylase biotin carboxyl carrier protein
VSKNSDFSMADVEQILRIVDQLANVDVEFQSGDIKLSISKHSPDTRQTQNRSEPVAAAIKTVRQERVEPAAVKQTSATKQKRTELPNGTVAIRSSMLGRFFASPSPNDPAFVKSGQRIAVGDTVALIEVMKLFNTLVSDVSGTVIDIRTENGEMVEFDQILFVVQPD